MSTIILATAIEEFNNGNKVKVLWVDQSYDTDNELTSSKLLSADVTSVTDTEITLLNDAGEYIQELSYFKPRFLEATIIKG